MQNIKAHILKQMIIYVQSSTNPQNENVSPNISNKYCILNTVG